MALAGTSTCRAQVEHTTAPATATPPAPAASTADVDRVLDGADRAAEKTAVLAARFVATRRDALTDDTERRIGELVVQGSGRARVAAILIRDFIDGRGRLERESRHFVYRDGWLTEFVPAERRATARQLALPDEDYDPLRAGEGPVPLPVGQRRADLEKGFVIGLSPWPSDAVPLVLPQGATATVLRMVPRDGSAAASEASEIFVAWDDQTFQPHAVAAHGTDGGWTTVRLSALMTNDGVAPESLALLAAPTLTDGEWTIDRRPKEGR